MFPPVLVVNCRSLERCSRGHPRWMIETLLWIWDHLERVVLLLSCGQTVGYEIECYAKGRYS